MRWTAALLCVLAACGPEPTQTLDDAVRAFDAGRYAESLRVAKDVQSRTQDLASRQQAAYLIGCASMELSRPGEARDAFALAARSQDPVVAGRALAKQGTLAVEDARWSEAASAFSAAASKLTGADADRARELAREAAAKAAEPKSGGARPAPTSTPAPPKPAAGADTPDADDAPPPIPAPVALPPVEADASWTVAAGVFGSETAARQRATNIAGEARRAGLPKPRVLSVPAQDRKVWVVEVGTFADKAKAEAARRKITTGDTAVVRSRAK
ncbi:MAG: SPOR domain-containing protein [Phycisphaerales bacterium]